MTGLPVDQAWPGLTSVQRREAVARLAEMLRALHEWQPPGELVRLVSQRPDLDLGSSESIVGADNNPLPLSRVHALAGHAGDLPFVDAGLVRAAVAAVDELAELEPQLDDRASGLTHGDVHLNNLWWGGTEVRALLDLEWTRFAPRDLELERLADNADIDVREGLNVYPQVLAWLLADYPRLAWLLADYPRLADASRMPDRLRLYSLTHALRHMFAWPPDRPEGELARDHPMVRLRRLVDGSWPAPGALPDILLP